MRRHIPVLLLTWLRSIDATDYSITWNQGLGTAAYNDDTLSVVTTDSLELSWSGGHNVYRADGACENYETLQTFMDAPSYYNISSTHPNQNPYSLTIPQVNSVTSYCYACISHYSNMKFTLTVSPSVDDIVCIDDTVGVRTPDQNHVPLHSVRIGDHLATLSGTTVVRDIVTQEVYDDAWVVPAGVCGATAPTILSPSHAIRCDGKWVSSKEVGKQQTPKRKLRYINLRTDDYCADMLLLETGVVVETWDGRKRDEWRPHSYEEGQRVNCESKNN